jgi:hypothetical protein
LELKKKILHHGVVSAEKGLLREKIKEKRLKKNVLF